MSCSCGDKSCSCVEGCCCPPHFCLCIVCFNLRKAVAVKKEKRNKSIESCDTQKYNVTDINHYSDGAKLTQVSNSSNDELENDVVFIASYHRKSKPKKRGSSSAFFLEIILSDSELEPAFETQNRSNDIEWYDVEEINSLEKTPRNPNRKRKFGVKSVCNFSNITANSKHEIPRKSCVNRTLDGNCNQNFNSVEMSRLINQSQASLVQHDISIQDYKNIHLKQEGSVTANSNFNRYFYQKSPTCSKYNAQKNKTTQESLASNIESSIFKAETKQCINERIDTKNSSFNKYFFQDCSDFKVYKSEDAENREQFPFSNIKNPFSELKTNQYGSCEQKFCFNGGKLKSGSEQNVKGIFFKTSTISKPGENSAATSDQHTDFTLPMETDLQSNERSASNYSIFQKNHLEQFSDFSAHDFDENDITKDMPDQNNLPDLKYHERHVQSNDSGGLIITAYPVLNERKYSENDCLQIVHDGESDFKSARNEKRVSDQNMFCQNTSNVCYKQEETYHNSVQNSDSTGEIGYKSARNEKRVSDQNMFCRNSSNVCYKQEETYHNSVQNADSIGEIGCKAARKKHVSFLDTCCHDSLEICNEDKANHAIRKRIRKRKFKSIKKEEANGKICTINEIVHETVSASYTRRRSRKCRKNISKKRKIHFKKKIKKKVCVKKEIKYIKVEIKKEEPE